MSVKKQNINRLSGNESKYVGEVLAADFRGSRRSGMLGRLEKAFAEKFGTAFAIGHVNGTATLHSALFALGVRPGDEVIVPPLTMSATSMAVLQADAIPVFADVEENTLQIDPKSIEKLITTRTKAIITVALYGLSPDMDPIMALAKKHNLKVIEDNAQCFLATYKGKKVGTFGDVSSYSFQRSKHMTSGEGGMICTDDESIADEVRKFSVLGYGDVSAKKAKITKDDIQNPNYNRHVTLGYNYRMSDLCAAVALGQVEHLGSLVERRIDSAKLFIDAIGDCSWLKVQTTPVDRTHSYWALPVRIVHPTVSWSEFRGKYMELGGDGIFAAWKLSYMEDMFQKKNFAGKEKIFEAIYEGSLQEWKPGLCPVAEKVQQQILAFKTNYWEWDRAEQQAEILKKTIAYFNGK